MQDLFVTLVLVNSVLGFFFLEPKKFEADICHHLFILVFQHLGLSGGEIFEQRLIE